MSYAAGETLLLTQIRAATGYTASNSTRGNWQILNQEGITTAVIVRPAPFEVGYGSARVDYRWRAVAEVWHKYIDDGSSLTNLEADVANIIARMILFPRMQDATNTIVDARITGGGDVLRVPPPPLGPHWLMQELTIEWQEQVSTTYSE